MSDQYIGLRANEAHRRKVLYRLVRQTAVIARIESEAYMREQQRVPVGRRLGDQVGAERRSRPALVLDHERLRKDPGKFLRENAPDEIGSTAGRRGNDNTYRLGGIRLCDRMCSRRDGNQWNTHA